MRRYKLVSMLVSLFLGVSVLSGCGGGSAQNPSTGKEGGSQANPATNTPPKEIDQVVIGLNGNVRTLDPTLVVDSVSRGVFIHIFDSLLHRTPDGKVESRLAEKWEPVGPTLVKVALKKGIKFSNGAEVTADDVKYSYDRYRNKEISEGAANTATIKEIRVIDRYNLEIETYAPDPVLKGYVSDGFFIVPKEAHSKDPQGFANNPIGSGPYIFKNWVRGDRLEVERREDYWGPKPLPKKVVWRFIPEASTRVAALLSGQLDIADEIPAQQVAAINSNPTTTVKPQPAQNITYINMRWDDPVLKNPKVRQALNYAVNRDALVSGVLQGQGKTQNQMLVEGILGFDKAKNAYPYNPEKAKQLLAEAGYPNGFDMNIEVPLGGPVVAGKEAAEVVAGDLRKVGVRVNLITTEWGTFFKKLFTPGQPTLAHAFVMYVKMTNYDPEEQLGRLFRNDAAWNWTHYNEPQIHDLLTKGVATVDQKEREQIYTTVNEVMTANPPWIFLFQPVNQVGVKKSLPWERPAANLIWVVDMVGK